MSNTRSPVFFIVFFALLLSVMAIRFQPLLEAYEQQCFYEHFTFEAKYRYFMFPESKEFVNYTLEIQYIHDNNTKILYSHQANTGVDQTVNLHKFAGAEGIHGFCITNNEARQQIFLVLLQSGIQLMQLQTLPAVKQAQIIQKQLGILRSQYTEILNSLSSIEGRRGVTQELFQLMSSKTLGFGILGIGVVIVVNLMFYHLIKRGLQERKRI